MDDITRAERERADLLAEITQAAEQEQAWGQRKNALMLKGKAVRLSDREMAAAAGMSGRGVGKLIKRERRKPGSADV
ncbi:hypothetical protein NLX83_13820 [Allokutzneria sp. A3M-2-11 16]|uniref:hypothetical protein n=1 Tax=Allokutzneria sp. A3M-2-11 16 TaxID=2962043 RepID=UPI0020B822BF|nr:hypothetical protein [Allokutzneria sp. A3M-2-11 16]MCP3800337.1 hypothetical protein [Allokutzneria sp. A3M-2-11 16]